MNAANMPTRPQACQSMLDVLDKNAYTITAYLPKPAERSRFMALAQRAVIDNPDVWQCTVPSVLRAIGAAAASGLPIDGKMSSLIVRMPKDGKRICVWDPSYRGMVYLALESGHVQSVEAHAVHQADEFSAELGTSPRIIHKPSLGENPGPVVAAYAYAVLTSGAVVREVLGRASLDQVRDSSPAAEKGPWQSWPDRMSMKSALRRLLKRLPAADIGSINKAVQHIIEHDDDPGSFIAGAGASPAELPDMTALEARAYEAIADAGTVERLAAVWVGVCAEFKAAKGIVPLPLEARYHDRREALEHA